MSFALVAEAFAEDCTRATIVISPRQAPGGCTALLIDRKAWRANGAMALRWTNIILSKAPHARATTSGLGRAHRPSALPRRCGDRKM